MKISLEAVTTAVCHRRGLLVDAVTCIQHWVLTIKIHASPEKQPPVRNGAYQTENEDVGQTLNEDVGQTLNEDVGQTLNEDVGQTLNEDVGQTLNEDVGQTLIYLNVSFIHTTEVEQQTDNSMFTTSSFNKQSLRGGGGGGE